MNRMAGLLKYGAMALTLLIVSTTLPADDLTGAKVLLCATATVNVCSDDGECTSGLAWNLNIPSFVEVDLVKKALNTTKASGENRTTPFKNLQREDGLIILQGAENGRAFSFVVVEETGMATVSIAKDGIGVVVFGVCTPKSGG